MASHANNHKKPSTPVAINAACQPHVNAIHGTITGVMTAPTFEPALKIPVANARSRAGNHSATVLIDAGKFPVSPRPSAKRAAANPFAVRASAVDIAAMLHATTDPASPLLVPKRSIIRPATRKP